MSDKSTRMSARCGAAHKKVRDTREGFPQVNIKHVRVLTSSDYKNTWIYKKGKTRRHTPNKFVINFNASRSCVFIEFFSSFMVIFSYMPATLVQMETTRQFINTAIKKWFELSVVSQKITLSLALPWGTKIESLHHYGNTMCQENKLQ